jgi:hypothetical protein
MNKFLIQLALFAVPVITVAQTADTKPLRVGLSEFKSPRQHNFSRAAEKQGVTATLVYEQLPDMLTPRIGHQTFISGKDLIVVGGRTTGFKLTATAERYADGQWGSVSINNAHDGAFLVRVDNGYMIGGGFSQDQGVGQTTSTSTFNSSSVNKLSDGPQLSTPRAMSKAVYVDGKVYVSGNWYAEDKTLDMLDAGAREFKSVGSTSSRSAPYMFYDNNGRIIVVSSNDNYGKSFGFYTEGGMDFLLSEVYDPSTSKTLPLILPFSPESYPMTLPDDASTDDYHVNFYGENLFFILAKEESKYALYAFDSDEMKMYNLPELKIPTTDTAGQTITWRGSVIADETKQEVYLIGVSGPATNQTLHIISMNYVTNEWTIATATGFDHNMLSASWTKLSDGRLACTGGGIKDYTDAQASAYIFTLPVAGRGNEEPDDSDGEDRKFLVVETKDHVKTAYMLADKTQVRFAGANLRVVSSKADVTYQLSDILRFTYETRSTTGISELRTTQAEVDYKDGQLVISGIKAGGSVNVYSLEGKLVKQLTAQRSGTYRFSLASLSKGVYIVKADNVTYKIMKR